MDKKDITQKTNNFGSLDDNNPELAYLRMKALKKKRKHLTSGTFSIASRKTIESFAVETTIEAFTPHNSTEKIALRKEIGLFYASAFITGVVIGSGIFVSPVSITQQCGSIGLSLIIWAVSGILTLGVALCYSEMASLFPHSGGEYSFFKDVLGPLPAFLFSWMCMIAMHPPFFAVLSMTASYYIFQPLFKNCGVPELAVKLFSVWTLFTFIVLNCVYVRYVKRAMAFFTGAKMSALIIIIIAGIVQIAKGNTGNLENLFEGTNTNPGAIAVSIYTGIFSYGGWQCIFFILEEVKEPNRTIPVSLCISILTVVVLYVFTNVSYFTVMTPAEMMQSNAVALTFAERTLGRFSIVIPLFVACSTLGALNGSVMGGSRIYFSAARDGVFPQTFAMIQMKYLTPWPSLWLSAVITTFYICTGDVVTMLESLGFLQSTCFLLTISCLLYLRKTKPELDRPIKIPLWIPIISFLVVTALVVLGLIHKPRENGIAVLILLAGIPVYMFLNIWKSKPVWYIQHTRGIFINLQKLFLVTAQEEDH